MTVYKSYKDVKDLLKELDIENAGVTENLVQTVLLCEILKELRKHK